MHGTRIDAPLRIALVGAGVFARKAHAPALAALQREGRVRVVAVASRTREKAEAVAAELPGEPAVLTGLEQVLAHPGVDAVDLVLPIPSLPGAVERCLVAGLHVVSEKPLAPDSATAERLLGIRAGNEATVWMVAENWRYEPSFVAAAKVLAEGRIGAPVIAHWAVQIGVRPGNAYHGTPWRRTGEVPGGFLLDAGVHFAAALRLVMGEVADVTALSRSTCADLPPLDTMAAALRFESGALATLAMTFAASGPWPTALHLVGTEGALRATPDRLEVTRGGATEVVYKGTPCGVAEELAAFTAAVLEGEPHRNTPQEAARDLALVERLLSSGVR